MQILLQVIGQKLAIGVSGTPDEVIGKMNSLFNHGAIETSLTLGSDQFAYGITTEEKLIEYFKQLILMKFDIDSIDVRSNIGHRLIDYTTKQAKAMLDAIPHETFLDYGADLFTAKPAAYRKHEAARDRIYRKLAKRKGELCHE